MELQDVINSRYSVRNFKDISVEKEKIDLLLETARIVPTASNRQPQRIMVVDDPEGLAKIDASTRCRFGAPLVLIICADNTTCWVRKFDGQKSDYVDASIVTTYLMLKAVDLGLGNTWVMHFDPAKLVEQFNLPENLTPVALLPLGYPSETSVPSEMHGQRNDLGAMLI